MREWVYLATLSSSLFCAAVNLYTWRVAYPLWRFAGAAFPAIHAEYLRRLDLVITLPHVAMFFASGALLFLRPRWFGIRAAVPVFVLDTLVIAVSLLLAGPVHDRFGRTGVADEPGMRQLVAISAVRSALMLASCAVLVERLAVRLRG